MTRKRGLQALVIREEENHTMSVVFFLVRAARQRTRGCSALSCSALFPQAEHCKVKGHASRPSSVAFTGGGCLRFVSIAACV